MSCRLLGISVLLSAIFAGTCAGQSRVLTERNESAFNRPIIDARSSSSAPSYLMLMNCAVSMDGRCFLDESENLLVYHYKSLWVEADQQAITSGRATDDNLPSKLMENINKMITEISNLFSNGFAGLFRDAKETDDNDLDEDEDKGEELQTQPGLEKSSYPEEGRFKKKKKKKAIKKLLVVGAVAAAKLALLLKAIALKIQLKFLVIAVLSLLINGARFFYDLKKGHQPQKVVYYEHAQHQHHYDHEDDWSGGGGHWDRALDGNEQRVQAQDLAYSKYRPYKPTYSVVNNKPNYSWEDE